MAYMGTCIYCGQICKVTKDHVPPKVMLAKQQRMDFSRKGISLYTVNSCEMCNHGSSNTDELFADSVFLALDPSESTMHSAWKERLPTHQKYSFSKLKKLNLKEHVILGNHGITASTIGVYTFDKKVLDTTINKVSKAILFKECSKIVGTNFEIENILVIDTEMVDACIGFGPPSLISYFCTPEFWTYNLWKLHGDVEAYIIVHEIMEKFLIASFIAPPGTINRRSATPEDLESPVVLTVDNFVNK